MLLDYEPQSSEQVFYCKKYMHAYDNSYKTTHYCVLFELQIPLLIDMGEQERALTKAIESGDTDLVYCVIFQILGQVCHFNQHPYAAICYY